VSRFRRMKAKEDEKDAITVVTGERDSLLRTLKEVQARNRWLEKRVASTADAAVVEGELKHYC
jgi:NADH:ubiquinone oxidoreductase subunit E